MTLIGKCTALEFLPIDLLGRTKGPPVVGSASYDSCKIVLEYIVGWIDESFTVTLMVVATLGIGDPVTGKRTVHIFRTLIAKFFGTQGQGISRMDTTNQLMHCLGFRCGPLTRDPFLIGLARPYCR